MISSRQTGHRRAPICAVLLAISAAGACRGSGGDGPAPAAAGAAARRYTVRGEVVAAPRPGARPPQLTLRHEAIPGFVDRDGAVVGMPSMVMALDLAPSVSAEGLRPGDAVEVVLAVDWTRPALQIEQVRKLPPGTALRVEPGPPPHP